MAGGKVKNEQWELEKSRIRKLYSNLVELGNYPFNKMERSKALYCFKFFETISNFPKISTECSPKEFKEGIEHLNTIIEISNQNPYLWLTSEKVALKSTVFSLLDYSNMSTLEILLNYYFQPFVVYHRKELLDLCKHLL